MLERLPVFQPLQSCRRMKLSVRFRRSRLWIVRGAKSSQTDLLTAHRHKVLHEMAELLNTGLDKDTLATCIGLIESGVNPDALAVCLFDTSFVFNR